MWHRGDVEFIMRTFSLIVAGLVALTVVEIAVLIAVAKLIGFGPTVLLVLVTSLVGAWLVRRAGRRAWRSVRAAANSGHAPGRQVVDGVLAMTGGLLMLVPGFVTDFVGLLMVVSPTRGVFRGLVERVADRRLGGPMVGEFFGPRAVKVKHGRSESDQTPIEGEIV
ncbi:MAG: FxsA family protein [Longispora sp.]|nr:FxsA family protein [Longispora sp. (in: high G+C Gram-positive bacteria)]